MWNFWGGFLGFDSKKLARDPLGLVDFGVHPLLDGLVSVGTGEDWKPGTVWSVAQLQEMVGAMGSGCGIRGG